MHHVSSIYKRALGFLPLSPGPCLFSPPVKPTWSEMNLACLVPSGFHFHVTCALRALALPSVNRDEVFVA